MNKTERERITRLSWQLYDRGFTYDECETLRKASNALSRWCERECNEDIERREDGRVYLTVHPLHGSPWSYPIRDMESAAKRKIDAILANHSGWAWYYQGDPRGVSVYLYRSNDERLSQYPIESIYSSIGIAIY